jgi:hypothetical protein
LPIIAPLRLPNRRTQPRQMHPANIVRSLRHHPRAIHSDDPKQLRDRHIGLVLVLGQQAIGA